MLEPSAHNPELLDFVRDLVADNLAKHGRATNGSQLAAAIREHIAPKSWQDLGYGRLADIVSQAEQLGYVLRNRQVPHLEVLPAGAIAANTRAPVATTPHSFIRPEVWRALVFVTNRQVTFVERATGQLVALASEDVSGIQERTADPRYSRLDPIPSEQQRYWAREFAIRYPEYNLPPASFEGTSWWKSLASWLEEQPPQVSRDWNQFRSARVLDIVKGWCSHNSVLLEQLLSPQTTPAARTADPIMYAGSAGLKRAILSALAELPLEQLENIPIPPRLLLRHLSLERHAG